jgi:HD-GYP domain-containing protein (c-di-GMP phosphodiesterase class II)
MPAALALAVRGTDRVIPLEDGARLTVGRVLQCDVQLEDQSVSRHHCTIDVHGDTLTITDLDSANGTFINERAIAQGTATLGDTVRLGATVLEVRGPGPHRERAGIQGFATVVGGRPDDIQSVISKRFEPAQYEWLAPTSARFDIAVLRRAQRHLTTIHRVSELLATARDLAGLADATLRGILEVMQADRAAVVLRRTDPDTGDPEVAAARGRIESDLQFTVSRTLVADVMEKGVSTFAHDASSDDRFRGGESVVTQHVRSVMCVPLRTTDQVLGALYVDSLSGGGRFNESDLELLAVIGNQAGVALHRVRLMGELERLLLDTIRAIAATIDAKDGYTHRHSERVAMMSKHIASALGMSAADQTTVHLSALLHDVGKIAVPDTILNKRGRLTPEEFEEMKKHPAHGARILANIQSPAIQAVLPGVQYHHEKWDGTGYPERLAGDAIPMLGRVLGVADYIDALTSARPYRGAMPIDEAIALVRKGAGTHFDPQIVTIVVRLHEAGDLVPSDRES